MFMSVMKKTRVSVRARRSVLAGTSPPTQATSRTSKNPSSWSTTCPLNPGRALRNAHNKKCAPRRAAGGISICTRGVQGAVVASRVSSASSMTAMALSKPAMKEVPPRVASARMPAQTRSRTALLPRRTRGTSTVQTVSKARMATVSSSENRSNIPVSASCAARNFVPFSPGNADCMLALTSTTKTALHGRRPFSRRPFPSKQEFKPKVSHVSWEPESGSEDCTRRNRGATRFRVVPVSK
mmetsp:Transcript_2206/g.6275  ORF Transcript_2206/g.6275 Transcript_2206/m.6275 type:complete len:240 (+) Transcript_2206:1183-1902(+)